MPGGRCGPKILLEPPAGAAANSQTAELDEEVLRARMDRGDLDAFSALVQHLSADDARQEEAHALLGQLVRTAPERTDALREAGTCTTARRGCGAYTTSKGVPGTARSPAWAKVCNTQPSSGEVTRV